MNYGTAGILRVLPLYVLAIFIVVLRDFIEIMCCKDVQYKEQICAQLLVCSPCQVSLHVTTLKKSYKSKTDRRGEKWKKAGL